MTYNTDHISNSHPKPTFKIRDQASPLILWSGFDCGWGDPLCVKIKKKKVNWDRRFMEEGARKESYGGRGCYEKRLRATKFDLKIVNQVKREAGDRHLRDQLKQVSWKWSSIFSSFFLMPFYLFINFK